MSTAPDAPDVPSPLTPAAADSLFRLRGRTPIAPSDVLLSVLIPVFNEVETLEALIELVHGTPIRKEIICVDDGSTDGSGSVLERLLGTGRIQRLLRHEVNRGKGAAVRAALAMSVGNVVIVQDADLEYDPADWPRIIEPILDGRADAVFGSRFIGGMHRVVDFWHRLGNRTVTTFSNMLSNAHLTDAMTCYKTMRGELARSLPLSSDRFGIDSEVTAYLAHGGARIFEVPVSYSRRSYARGKKIRWHDGLAALAHIVRFNIRAWRWRSARSGAVPAESGRALGA